MKRPVLSALAAMLVTLASAVPSDWPILVRRGDLQRITELHPGLHVHREGLAQVHRDAAAGCAL